MLYTGKETETNPQGHNPKVNNNLEVVKASGGAKFGFILLSILTLGLFYIIARVTTMNWLNRTQIQINNTASGIDVQLEKRYDTLTKLVDTVKSHTQFNKEVYENIAAYRSGMNPNADTSSAMAADLNRRQDLINKISGGISMQFEQYPTLGADASISRLMTESIMIEKEIASARRLYNSVVTEFNSKIYTWPTCVIVDKKNYSGIPLFIASEQKRVDIKTGF